MDSIESESYCDKCQKSVIAQRSIPKITWYYKTLSYLSFGFWPIYWIRVRWKCKECGSNADAEKLYIIARQMGGLRRIDDIYSNYHCPTCQKETRLTRKLPQPSSLHQLVSFFSGGVWPYQWLKFGWKCTECKSAVDGYLPNKPVIVLESKGFCHTCGKDVPIKRRMPSFPIYSKILSFITAGSFPFQWFQFGWECLECLSGPDVKQPPVPKDEIVFQQFCPKCQQETKFQKKSPSLTIVDRFLSILSGGFWSVFRINYGWRCRQCQSKIKMDWFS